MDLSRYDYILIWGNGQKHRRNIIKRIQGEPGFTPVFIKNYENVNVKKIVKAVYSFDYAPFDHLKSKTKYLLATEPNITIIVVKNDNPNEDYLGEGRFRHIESLTLKCFKERLRNEFNDWHDGKRSEDHVIHASDNPEQTDYILKFLGIPKGISTFECSSSVVWLPYHISNLRTFRIKQLNMKSLLYRQRVGGDKTGSCKFELVPISESPHYKALIGDDMSYKCMLDKHHGWTINDNHSLNGLISLSKKFVYLAPPYENHYIMTRKYDEDKYVIMDGSHRAAILLAQERETAIFGVV